MKYDLCILGGCTLDEMYFQNIDGTYNEKPDMVVPGGKGANQAVAAARAGAKTVILTRIGYDDNGKMILNNLAQNNVDTKYVELVTGLENDCTKIKVSISDKDNKKERRTTAIDTFTADMIDKYKDVILSSKIILCQLKNKKEVTEALINFCYANNKPVVLTPDCPEKFHFSDIKNKELFAKVAMIVCNKSECIELFESDDLKKHIKMFPNKLFVTYGADGLVYHDGNQYVHLPAIKTEVVDTVGAGDTLTGNLCAFLLAGKDLKIALTEAMYASAMKIMQPTAQKGMPTLEELKAFIKHKNNTDFEYKEELKYALEIVKGAYDVIKSDDKLELFMKKDNSIITDADIVVERYLIGKIKEKYPTDSFITEEFKGDKPTTNRTWIIDPIDGVSHFINSTGAWGIQLAFYDKNYTKFGIIYLPEKDELYYAAENQGVYLNNKKLEKPVILPIHDAVIEFGGSIANGYEIKEKCLERLLKDDIDRVSNILYIKSCCTAYTNLLTNKTSALITAATSPWDVMPGELMCRELGIEITYLDKDKRVKLFSNNQAIKDVIIPIV